MNSRWHGFHSDSSHLEGFRCHRGRDWWHSQECILPRIFQPGLLCPGLDHYSGAWTSWVKRCHGVQFVTVCWLVPEDGCSSCWCLQRLGAQNVICTGTATHQCCYYSTAPITNRDCGQVLCTAVGLRFVLVMHGWQHSQHSQLTSRKLAKQESHHGTDHKIIKCSGHFRTCSISFVAKPVKDFHGLNVCQSIRSQPAVAFFVANTYYILTLLVLIWPYRPFCGEVAVQNLKVVSQLFPTQFKLEKHGVL